MQYERHLTMNKFAIYTINRTASSKLCDVIDALDNARCGYEIFNLNSSNPSSLRTSLDEQEIYDKFLSMSEGNSYVGFKFFNEQFVYRNQQDFIRDNDIKVFSYTRYDILSTLLSTLGRFRVDIDSPGFEIVLYKVLYDHARLVKISEEQGYEMVYMEDMYDADNPLSRYFGSEITLPKISLDRPNHAKYLNRNKLFELQFKLDKHLDIVIDKLDLNLPDKMMKSLENGIYF